MHHSVEPPYFKGAPSMKRRAFTLIELLIVVAIIAILAAIAVPNFLEAQVRSKVSRCAADMRSLRTAIESYRVDNNHYPETDTGVENIFQPGVGLFRATTPVAYITSVPKSPFREENMGAPAGAPKNCNKMNIYLWVRAEHSPGLTQDSNTNKVDDNYESDRIAYISQNVLALNNSVRATGFWEMKSVGPDNLDDRKNGNLNARIYDSTNGTASPGDIIMFSDQSGFAKPMSGP